LFLLGKKKKGKQSKKAGKPEVTVGSQGTVEKERRQNIEILTDFPGGEKTGRKKPEGWGKFRKK